MKKIIKNNLPIIILAFIAIIICFKNYTPGTILSGWDTLHPEFNFGLAIKRELSGVFREYQGLGAVAAHSDMADLPRIITLAVFNLFLPMDFLRYSYIFLNIILGPIGMYFFLKYIFVIPNSFRDPIGISRHFAPRDDRNMPAFLGALFYLLNLGTMQQFIVPFEMFTTQYSSLPWLFLFATDYIYNKTYQKRSLILFALTTLLAAPMAYAATLWYIYFIAFTIYLGVLILLCHPDPSDDGEGSRFTRDSSATPQNDMVLRFALFKKAFILILLTLLINSFWILPNIYFLFNHASEVTQANISKLFSPQAFLYNKEFGNIADISILKSFLFDWNVYSGSNQFTQLLSPWIVHLKQPFVLVLGYLFAGIAFSGIVYSIFKKNKIAISFLPVLILSLFFLFNDNSPTSPLYTFLTDKIPFFREAFRFPHSKLYGIFTFVFAIYFAFGQLFITRFITSMKHQEGWRAAQLFIFTILLIYFMLPAFKGHFISPYMRIKIPEYYFEMFKWFDKEPRDGRIANLPIHSLWGWEYYDWYQNSLPSFQGAGFIWFGIKQPILARDFDRWTPYNEQYYREMSYAIYSQNEDALKIVLEKYNIKYVIFDKSIIAPQNNSKVLLRKETQALLDKQGNIEKIKEFGNTIFVYKVKSDTPNNTHVIQNPALIQKESPGSYEDVPYKDYGNYIVDSSVILSVSEARHQTVLGEGSHGILLRQLADQNDNRANTIYYPLLNLIDNGGKILPNKLLLTQEGVVITLPKDRMIGFTLPSYLDTQRTIPADVLVEKRKNQLIISLYPLFPNDDIKKQPTPIITKTLLPQTNDIILTINKKNSFIFNVPTNGAPLSLGTVLVNTKKDNTIAIYPAPQECQANTKSITPWCGVYPSHPNETILPDLSTIKYYVEPCENIDNQRGYRMVPSFGIEKDIGNSFYIFGKNVSLCMTIPFSEMINNNLKSEETLLNVTFNYKSNLPLKFCLAELINGACQNYSDNRLNQYFGAHQTVHPFGLQREDLQDLGLKFQLDTTNSDSIEKAFYSNLTVSLTSPIYFNTLPIDSLKKSLGSIEQNLTESSTLTLPYSSNRQLSQDITKLPKTNGFCPNTPFSNSPLIKKQILENNNDRFIRYESIDGVLCDHFSYQNLSQNEAYLVAITSRHIKGLPSTLCITNTVSKHCDIYTTLSSYKDFNTDIFLLPPQIKDENGFDINIGNLGIKKSPSINDLKSIEIIPIPYKWLTQIKTLDPNPKQNPNSVLVLPQSFEKGWKAYRINVKCQMSNVKCFIQTSFPFIFGEELKDHILVNGWENGWILNSGTMKQSNNETIVILFLPQYLEYLGFLLLLGTGVWLIKK